MRNERQRQPPRLASRKAARPQRRRTATAGRPDQQQRPRRGCRTRNGDSCFAAKRCFAEYNAERTATARSLRSLRSVGMTVICRGLRARGSGLPLPLPWRLAVVVTLSSGLCFSPTSSALSAISALKTEPPKMLPRHAAAYLAVRGPTARRNRPSPRAGPGAARAGPRGCRRRPAAYRRRPGRSPRCGRVWPGSPARGS